MLYKRITAELVEIDGALYVRHDPRHDADGARSHILAVLRHGGELTHGVLLNRCRKWLPEDVRGALDDLLTSKAVDCRATIHARTSRAVFHYSIAKGS